MIKLRQAIFSDCDAIAKLHADNWRQTYRGILSDQFLDNEVEIDRLDTWHERLKSPSPNQLVIVATSNEAILGFCCLFLNDDPVFGSLLDNLHVTSSMRKSGIGKMLINDCVKYICDKAHTKKMYLWVYEANTNARIAYERLGGKHFETVTKKNEDGNIQKICRIIWEDVRNLSTSI